MDDTLNKLICESMGKCWHEPDPHHNDECLKCHSAFQKDNYEPHNCAEANPDYFNKCGWQDAFDFARDDSLHSQPVEVGCWECGGNEPPWPETCICSGKGRVRLRGWTFREFEIFAEFIDFEETRDEDDRVTEIKPVFAWNLIGPAFAEVYGDWLKTLRIP